MSDARRACVIGWPVGHSRSPLLHGHWLAKYGIDGTYGKEAVPQEDIERFLQELRERGYAGANVTVPHKEVACSVAQHREPSAVAVGAANTLWLEGGELCADNTDTYGFLTHLNTVAPYWHNLDAAIVILGAGGAARAIAFVFLEAGRRDIILLNRTLSRADSLVEQFGGLPKVVDWEDRNKIMKGAGVLVNTTSLGMTGSGDLAIDVSEMKGDGIVADIVYSPLETALLRSARECGLKTVDGLGMLLHQAVPGFERWFGVRPEVTDELRDLVIADLAKDKV